MAQAANVMRNRVSILLAVIGGVLMLAGTWRPEWRPYLVAGAALSCVGIGVAWRGRMGLAQVLIVAGILRLVLFAAPPTLSTDVHRYLWDGQLCLAGINPYQYKPSELTQFHQDPVYARITSPELYSPYPPVCQILFAVAAWLPFSAYALKLMFGACELIALAVFSRKLPPRELLLYAWNPLIVLETWGQPHAEAVILGGLALALYARPAVAVTALSVCVSTKLWPVLLMPFLLRKVGWRYVWIFAGLSALLWFPFVRTLPHILETLRLYSQSFEWNAGPFYLLDAIRWGAVRLFHWEGGAGKWIGPALQIVLLIALPVLYVRSRGWALEKQFAAVVIAFTLTLATIHPWYLAPVLALLPFARWNVAGWFVLSVASLGTYLFYTHGSYWPWVVMGWTGWLLGAIASASGAGARPRT